MSTYILAIDQGTTNTRAVLVDKAGKIVNHAEKGLKQYFPDDGWVEHDANEIWEAVLKVCREVLDKHKITAHDLAGIGVTNQRETTFVWDKKSGEPIYHAIVWQDRRTAEYCKQLIATGCEDKVQVKTGLRLDPYFSATKLHWILEQVPGAREKAERGELLFGTADCYLLWRLTGGAVHATDATNASRTLLFNIVNQTWDEELLKLFNIPKSMLPKVLDCSTEFGKSQPRWLGQEVPILGIAGDQQAALIGQACFQPGMAKTTYGTGCFMVLNTGESLVKSRHQLLSTIAYRLGGKVHYALEGSIFVAGAVVQWLRDKAHLIHHAHESAKLAADVPDNGGVYFIPAFTGLGAPYWDPNARGAIVGLTRDSDYRHIVRAALESVCYQTRDLLGAMAMDYPQGLAEMRVDGGMVANDWMCQFLTDMLQVAVARPMQTETTVLGAAYLAGLRLGWFKDLNDLATHWQRQAEFKPKTSQPEVDILYANWQHAVKRVL